MLATPEQIASLVLICNHHAIYPILQVRRLSLGEAVGPPTCLAAGKGLCCSRALCASLSHTHRQPSCHQAGLGVPILPTVPGMLPGLRNHLLNEPMCACLHTSLTEWSMEAMVVSQQPDVEGRASSGSALPEVTLCRPRLLAPPAISTTFPLGRVSCCLSHAPHFFGEHALPSPPWGERTKEGLEGGPPVCGKL